MAGAAMQMAQMNVRMEPWLKDSGDAVLDRMGVAPSEIVRALWAKIGEGAEQCEQVLSILVGQRGTDEEVGRGKALMLEVDTRREEIFRMGGSARMAYVSPTDEELDELLYNEMREEEAFLA